MVNLRNWKRWEINVSVTWSNFKFHGDLLFFNYSKQRFIQKIQSQKWAQKYAQSGLFWVLTKTLANSLKKVRKVLT